jgi:hypothetical protein
MSDERHKDEFELLRRLLAGVPDSAEAEARARARLEQAIAEEQGKGLRRPLPLLRLAIGAAVLVGVVVGLVLGGPRLGSSAAQAALTELAQVAERQPATTLPPGTYAYTRSEHLDLAQVTGADLEGSGLEVLSFQLESTREIWIDPAGTRRLRTTVRAAHFFSAEAEEAFGQLGLAPRFGIGEVSVEVFGPQETDIRPEDWPADPDELAAEMRARVSQQDPGIPLEVRLLELGATLLRETGAGPQLRAAVLEVLAGLKGLEREPEQPSGEIRISITYESSGVRRERTVGFDPATSQLTFERERVLDSLPEEGITAGATVLQVRYLPSLVVDEPGPAR